VRGILTVVVLVAGCGRVDFGTHYGPVSIKVQDDGFPIAGIDVIFSDRDGNLDTNMTTDANGTARLDGAEHGMALTIVDTSSSTITIETIAGIEPGDEMTRGTAFDPWAGAGDLMVTLPGPTQDADTYDVGHGCGVDTLTDPMAPDVRTRPRACAPPGGVAVLAVARDVNGDPLAYASATGLTITPGTEVQVSLPAWSTDWQNIFFEISPPFGATDIHATAEELTNGITYLTAEDATATVAPNVELQVARPTVFAGAFGYTATAYLDNGELGVSRRIESPVASSIAIDLTAGLPPLSSIELIDDTEGRPTLAVVPWSSIENTTGVFFEMSWTATTGETVRWYFTLPPDTVDYRLPELPESLANLRPPGGASVTLGAAYYRADFMDGGYAGIRRDGWWFWSDHQYYLPDTLELWHTQIGTL